MVSAASPPWMTLQRAIIGYRLSFALGVAARLGLADLLRDGPRSVYELAAASGSNEDALRRMLCLLASEGFFEQREADAFSLTPAAEMLRTDVVGSMRERAIIEAEEWARVWADLGHSVATGKPGFERQFGVPLFDYYQRDAESATRFDATMTSMTTHVTPALVEAMDLPDRGTVVDVGGGQGTLLRAMLEDRPRLCGVLFDVPHVVERARPALADLLDRCDLIGGDFFEAVPGGGDVYVLKFIMDDWGPEDSLRILSNCRRAMAPGGRILINEMVLRPGNTPFYGRWTDVNMLVLLGGRERTEAEYRELLDAAGLRLTSVRPTASDFSIVEAVAQR
ncbi:MAG TPA: methyltransferase [Chloroflexota bacterium]